jgi:hypothetical protein
VAHRTEDHDPTHRLLAFVRAEELVVVRCTCGWLTRAGNADDGFGFLDRHLDHATC